jgi:hypothetical protein
LQQFIFPSIGINFFKVIFYRKGKGMTYYINAPVGLPTYTQDLSKVTIGRCSKCGGNVSVHAAWMSVLPDVPTCESCGAKKASNLPRIEME